MLVAVGLALGPGRPAMAAAQGLAPLVDAGGAADGAVGAPWRFVGLPQQRLPATGYSAVRIDGRPALRIDARGSYGNLVHAIPVAGSAASSAAGSAGSPAGTLSWAWRVDQPNPAADLRRKAGDDSPVKVCLSFDMAADRVPFFERQLLKLARTRSGEALPAATLCYVWDAREPAGTLLANAYTARVRLIVLRGAADPPGRWFDERRDIAADFRRAFGDESSELPSLAAVIVAGDADNTGASSLAFVADLRLEP